MAMSSSIEIRDPIHGSIDLSAEEARVLDHPWVQRLRHIRQLGFVSLVYPGAVHDRLQHSLGVCHLAGRAFDHLLADKNGALSGFDPEVLTYARRVLRLAGLLHDAGHAAFSHTAERFLGRVEPFRLPADWYRAGMMPAGRPAQHEDCTLLVIHGLAQSGVIAEDEARDICAVLHAGIRRSPRLRRWGSLVSVLRALVSGELDVDREDYLLRDSHFCGVSYGIFDLGRLLDALTTIPGERGPELALDGDGIHAFEGLLLARYHMFLQVYFHKTPPAFEFYLEQAVAAGEIRFDFPAGLQDVLDCRDDVVHGALHTAAAEGGEWSRRIIHREPARLVMRERVGEADGDNSLSLRVHAALQNAGCRVFTRHSRQRFTNLHGAGGVEQGEILHGTRRVLGRRVIHPLAHQSHLLTLFNRPIDIQYTYVLRADAERAAAVLKRLDLDR
ncbi:MAG: HD domain-containing protein [Planctomycetota bacterium]|nr:MAG: HD domain-containing protein [Planctomycetota bacterium]